MGRSLRAGSLGEEVWDLRAGGVVGSPAELHSTPDPVAGLAPGVGNGPHNDAVPLYLKEDHLREASDQRPSPRVLPHRKAIRVFGNGSNSPAQSSHVLQAQARALSFVPAGSLLNLELRVFLEDDGNAHVSLSFRRILDRTSLHGLALSAPAARRRASSASHARSHCGSAGPSTLSINSVARARRSS